MTQPQQPPSSAPPPAPPTNPPTNGDKTHGGDTARLIIALSLILGMIVILIIPAAQGQYAQAEQLAAIFSGWVTTIIAFYFYGQSNAQAQTQIKNSADSAAKSEQEASQAKAKLNHIKGMTKAYAATVAVAYAAPDRGVEKPKPAASDEILKKINELLEE